MAADADRQKRKVFLVDDHPLVREWLAALINQQPDLEVCGEAASASEGLAHIAIAKPHAAIVDLSMQGGSGLELIKEIKAICPEVEILVLSMHEEELYRERVLRAGARGYVTKKEATQVVLQAVRTVLEGKLYLTYQPSPPTADPLTGLNDPVTDSLMARLSDRELEVFHLLGRGLSTRQIAEELHINFRTVQAFCARIKEKLKLSSATKLLAEAIRWHDAQNAK